LPALLLAACAANPPPVAETETLELIDISETLAALGAETIDIRELDNGRVCERRVPTGSRISEEWCYTRADYEALQTAMHDDIQRDMNEMRQLQEARRMAEQGARNEAMRRAGGGF
jgi:hypothetical protein